MKKIVTVPDPILRRISSSVVDFNQELLKLEREMKSIVLNTNALGLAAPQIGISLRMFIFKSAERLITVINPTIIEAIGSLSYIEEGCLSVPGITRVVPRHTMIKLEYQGIDKSKKQKYFANMEAVIIQHEYHHLMGITILESGVDRESV